MRSDLLAVVNPSLVPLLDRAERDVGEQWRDHSALGRAGGRRKKETFFENSSAQELPHQFRHLQVADADANALHQQMVIDMIEAALDVALDDPLVRPPLASAVAGLRSRAYGHADMLQSAMASSSWAEPIRDVPEVRFEERLQKILDRVLNDAVSDSGDSQGSELPRLAGLGDQLPSAGARSIPARPQFVAKLHKECFAPFAVTNPQHRHPIDTGGTTAFVTGNLAPGAP
jgi:hypothetical protein